MNNLWILTEERPKNSVVSDILKLENFDVDTSNLKIVPRIENGKFEFIYDVEGVYYPEVNNIYLKIVSGNSSFFDYMIVLQENEPNPNDKDTNILYVVEETKTNDQESRNTGVYQRCSKFVYIDLYHKGVNKYMLYNNESGGDFERRPSDTNVFGTNMLLTIGARFHGKNMMHFSPFGTLEQLIEFKSGMRRPPAGNTPIDITRYEDRIEVSGMLSKPADKGNIGHDPNIGALSIIGETIRELGWDKRIVITKHGVTQSYVDKTKGKNKFLYICDLLGLELQGIVMPTNIQNHEQYWKYENKSEKVASILTHIHAENNGFIGIYENHAGCERGYFYDKSRNPIALPKKDAYGENLYIPDLILYHPLENTILLIEGKQYSTLNKGLEEINNYDSIESQFIKNNYPGCKIERWITLFGGNNQKLPHKKVLLQLTDDGRILVNENAPESFRKLF